MSEPLPSNLVERLRSLPTPQRSPDFWSELRQELSHPTSTVDKVEQITSPSTVNWKRLVIAAAAIGALAVGAARIASSRTTPLETVPASEQQDRNNPADEESAPIGPFNFVVHDATDDGRTLVATRLVGDERPCYEAADGRPPQSGFGAELLLVDAADGTGSTVVADIVVQTEELFTDRSAVAGPDRFAVFNWCDPPSASFFIVDPTSDPPRLVTYEPSADIPVPSAPVWSLDGDTLMMTFRGYPGDEPNDLVPRLLVTYDATTGQVLTEEPADRRLLAEFADGSRLSGAQDGSLYLDDQLLAAEFDAFNTRVETSLDGQLTAVFNGDAGLTVIAAGNTQPRYTNKADVRAVEWLPDGSLLASSGCCGAISEVIRIQFGPDGEPADERPVQLGLDGFTIEEMTLVAGDRLAVSGSSGRDRDVTWIAPLPAVDAPVTASANDLERLIPEAADFGPQWSDWGTDTDFGGRTIPDEGPPPECPDLRSVTFPDRTFYAEYSVTADDASVFVAQADSPAAAVALAEGMLSWSECSEMSGLPPAPPAPLEPTEWPDAQLAIADGMAIGVIDSRVLIVAVSSNADAADVIRTVLAREAAYLADE